ncbi:uncharacterized protein K02A2.6-like isoform X2 [Anopheles bellator]|nr:uncharacterized protein K02A2.6-like isoform X2 [Anopheles bellator]XP_058057022.1 uncharacterized protein K02A2.6-like isoform X2 [Anopheles bellator]XP_058057023.1 uncharacterized protein K02A2.6-like isoform X2 [Anopheles bellator]
MIRGRIGAESIIFLLDTGASVNTVTEGAWWNIREGSTACVRNWTPNPEEQLKGYGNANRLETECAFEAVITAAEGGNGVLAKFFVVKGANTSLLGYETAQQLGLIKIGTDACKGIYNICEEASGEKEKEFPKMSLPPVKIRFDEMAAPKQIIRYNIPKAFEKAVGERLEEMERRKIIERVDSRRHKLSFVSPLVLVPKGINDFRIVVDFREVNKAIVREPYPMPSLERIWANIPNGSGALWFSKIDLKDAYFHVELCEKVRHLTTFMTANGLMRYRRLPFGLSCAPEVFQHAMERIFANCRNTLVYLDDLLIHASSKEDLERKVKIVKEVACRAGLTINEMKSSYNVNRIDFLGLTLDGEGILPTREKLIEIQEFERPKDVTELRSFLGMLTFISPFIKNFSHRTKSLRESIIPGNKFKWGEQQQRDFEEMKRLAKEEIVKRGYFKEEDDTILYTDASPWGLGAVLVQEDKSAGRRRVIACASKSLTKTESRYPQLHREALAIVWAMERFAFYLIGRKFLLKSDSEALMFMLKRGKVKDVGKRIMSRAEGWFLRIQHYDFTCEHIAGSQNIADAPSRLVGQREVPHFGSEREPHELFSVEADVELIGRQRLALTAKQIKEESDKDETLQLVMKWTGREGKWPEEIGRFWPFAKELYVRDGMLLKQEKLVLPATLSKRALSIAHRSHPGITTMKNVLRSGLWWPGMDREIELFVRSCQECQLITAGGIPAHIETTELPENPWDFVAMDISTVSEKWKALVLTDYYSRFLVVSPIGGADSEAVKQVLDRVFRT